MTYDSDAHTIRVCCGIADNSLDVNILNSTHSGTIGMHHMSKTANGGTNWEWTQDCGFGADYVGVTDPSLLNPVPGPGHLCGQEFLTPTTTNIGVNGLWCLDYGNGYGGGISSRGGTNCGFRMVFGGYDPTYQAWVLFGGSNGNALGCETILYYAATDTWRSLTNGAVPVGCGTTYPSARWNPAASRMVSLGNGKLLLFGGGGNGSSALNDTWIFQSCPSINIAACGWTKVNSTVNPAADNGAYNGVLDWVSSLGMVVYLDAQSPAHWWTFDPSGWQWADQGTGACDPVAGCPTFPHRTDGVNFYYHVGAYDAYTDQLVVFATCATTTTPTCATTQNPIWVLGFGNSALRLRKAL